MRFWWWVFKTASWNVPGGPHYASQWQQIIFRPREPEGSYEFLYMCVLWTSALKLPSGYRVDPNFLLYVFTRVAIQIERKNRNGNLSFVSNQKNPLTRQCSLSVISFFTLGNIRAPNVELNKKSNCFLLVSINVFLPSDETLFNYQHVSTFFSKFW